MLWVTCTQASIPAQIFTFSRNHLDPPKPLSITSGNILTMPVWEQDRSQVPLPKEVLAELPGCVAGGVPGFRAALAPSPAALPLSRAGAAN